MKKETDHKLSAFEALRSRFDALRPALGVTFVATYVASALGLETYATTAFLVSGAFLYAISVPWASRFHRGLALVSFLALGVALATGRFDAAGFVEGIPAYLAIVAVLLVLSVAGYPIRAARYEAQIRALVATLSGRGFGSRTASGIFGHVLGAVLDVGTFVLVDVILRRALGSRAARIETLTWTARAYSFAPLWTNVNLLTATAIVLTGVSYPALLAITLPFALLGLVATLFAASRSGDDAAESPAPDAGAEPLDRRAVAVLAYPVLLVVAVALVDRLMPEVPLTVAIAVTVSVAVVLIGALASALTGGISPVRRLTRETRDSLTASHAEFTLFGSAGILVLSLTQLGALDPLGLLLASLPQFLVPAALALVVALGFLAGIHVIPLVLLVDTVFPLDGGQTPALWAAAIMLGAQSVLLLTPFSNAVTMLSRLSGLHPLQIGPEKNWRFALILGTAGLSYLFLLTLMLV